MSAETLATVRAVGSALPADVLSAVVSGDDGLGGLDSDAYRLEFGVSPREAANRAWSVLSGAYAGYRKALDERPAGDPAVGLTREKWLAIALRELGFGRVPTTPASGLTADDRGFPISHVWGADAGQVWAPDVIHVPVHLLGWGVDLDKRTPGQAGAADRAPHALVQEYLNRTDAALWGLVGNGRKLRLLRDSSTLIGQSFVEFDLEAMFDGEVFSDFVVLFLVCHATRFETSNPDGTAPDEPTAADCRLERWRSHAAETGVRALAALRPAVAKAIEVLGTGFTSHPHNDLHCRLAAREITPRDLHHGLLRLVYRMLFCFVAEDRGLLLDPAASPTARERYANWFSTARLRGISERRHGSSHSDLWGALRLVFEGLGQEGGRPELGLPGLGGIFELGESDVVAGLELSNAALLKAVRHLTVVQPSGGGPKRRVDYRNLGAEELGSVYEALLEFEPRYDESRRSFSLETVKGNERKTSGSYYTPSSLIDCLLDSALDPLLDDAEKADDPEQALLALTVCDPACGSGHFLVAAAKRIAARLATVRARAEGAQEPTPLDEQAAMHEVVDRCIYGVDLNPLAAELAKVSLWLESVQPGRALSFLDAHIKVGNALLGATPALLAEGIPDGAFKALDGDDKKWAASLRKRNRQVREVFQDQLFDADVLSVSTGDLRSRAAAIDQLPTVSLADVHLAARRHREFEHSPELRRDRLVADAWCAAFMAIKTQDRPAITTATLRRLAEDPGPISPDGFSASENGGSLAAKEAEAVRQISDEYKFFHWHIEFPQIFGDGDNATAAEGPGWAGGFDCVLGNPPWEKVQMQEKEFFAAFDPEIAGAPNASARKRLIKTLPERNRQLFDDFVAAKRQADGKSQFLRLSGRYPLCGRGHINTYAVFAEHDHSILAPTGRLGVIVPTGIATDATTQHFFRQLVERASLVALHGFENSRPLFEGVHRSFKFCLLTVAGREERVQRAEFAFFQLHPDDLAREGTRFELSPDEIRLLNPNTGTCPVFRSRRDAEITIDIYRRHPVLINENPSNDRGNPWGLSFMQMLNMSSESHHFHTRQDLESEGWTLHDNIFTRDTEKMLPLYEAKMIHLFDHRWATYEGPRTRYLTDGEKADPSQVVLPRYWVNSSVVAERLGPHAVRSWLLGFRDITNSTNERTVVATLFPKSGVGNNLPIAYVRTGSPNLLCLALGSIALDFCARLKIGGTHLNFFIAKQLPVPTPEVFADRCAWDATTSVSDWLRPRDLELRVTSYDLVGYGQCEQPFKWDPERRKQLRAEIDAAFFHIYGLNRTDTEYVLGTFPIANREDPELTPRILREYDAMQHAIDTGTPYQSPLDPPPGAGPRHPPR